MEKTVTATDTIIRAQVLDLDRWLIPQQNAEIPRFTFGNQVDLLIDGKAAFGAMHKEFSAATQGGYIYITAWDLVPTIHLLGATGGGELQRVLGDARSRGADVRVLLTYINAIKRHAIPTWESVPWAQLFVDNKTRHFSGSHHQKTAAVRTSEGLVSFVGGIDLTLNRWDTPAHRFRDPDGEYEPKAAKPWHDVHARVHGPAAADIETNFRQRWNDRHNPPDLVPVHHPRAPLPDGPHIVQTLRTFPEHASAATVAWRYDFAPHGEFGLRQAYRRAIDNARDFVFIEDQYFDSEEISTSLATAMTRSARLQVILVTAPVAEEFPESHAFHQNQFVDRLNRVDPGRVAIYHLVNATGTGIYCHAKICVVDDIWAIVGSCNMNRRSLTNDAEISIAVLDETVERNRRKFARQLRISLWAEHLGLTLPPDLPLIDDPVTGIGEWAKRAGTPGSPKPPAQAIRHGPLSPASDSLHGAWDSEIDPDGSIP